jgi:dTDP-4-amino-4,6-dideoxygalactose transaminase
MPVELFKPSVPPLASYLKYLEAVDKNQMYSNFGPVHNLFKDRLAKHFEVSAESLELFSSGTMALIAALEVLKRRDKPYCLLPSWTFVATAQSVIAAGLQPIFVDVEFDSMQLSSRMVSALPREILEKTSVVLVVSPFGAPLMMDGYKALCKAYQLDILCDCAAGFDSVHSNEFHTIISLHATKTFGIGEGGLLMSPNKEFLVQAKGYSNFGFLGSRQSKAFGVNGKLSELHSAVGLAALDLWPQTKDLCYEKAGLYREAARELPIKFQDGWGDDWVSSTCVIKFDHEEHKSFLKVDWDSREVQTRDWWNQGCHLEPFFKDYPFFDLEGNTKDLATKTLGIPFYRDISTETIQAVFHLPSLKLNDG